jgi:two-component system LytT family response regulator
MDAPPPSGQTRGMSAFDVPARVFRITAWPSWLVECACGFLYWLAFLVVLEPDNVLRANQAGHPLLAGQEALRIVVAALLGSAVTPTLLGFSRRFPLHGPQPLRHGLVQLAGITGLAFVLIVVSCFLAAWGYEGVWLPSLPYICDELVGNGLLLAFALFALAAIASVAARLRSHASPDTATHESPYLTRIPVKHRGKQGFVELAQVDWIETQGNYLVLHVGPADHMIRETSVSFEAKLDPQCFVRIHRRTIVAIDRVRQLQPLTNGDALLGLASGQELRASRNYRKVLMERWVNIAQSRAPTEAYRPDPA